MNLIRRNQIVPQMFDYDRVGEMWVPYLMSFHRSSIRLPSVSTDEHGFRTTIGNNRPLECSILHGDITDNPNGIVLGSSAVFGVGATDDKFTIPSRLNSKTRLNWHNFGGRAFNSSQELLIYTLHQPMNHSALAIVSGVNNLTLAYLSSTTSPIYNSFFGQSTYEREMQFSQNRVVGVRKSASRLLNELRYKFLPQSRPVVRRELGKKYNDILSCFRRDLIVLRNLTRASGAQLHYFVQPLASWIEKKLSSEELETFKILDEMGMDWKVLAEYVVGMRDQYIGDLRAICRECNVAFCDMNNDDRYREDKWLFVDRVHMTDLGYDIAADIIKGEMSL